MRKIKKTKRQVFSELAPIDLKEKGIFYMRFISVKETSGYCITYTIATETLEKLLLPDGENYNSEAPEVAERIDNNIYFYVDISEELFQKIPAEDILNILEKENLL